TRTSASPSGWCPRDTNRPSSFTRRREVRSRPTISGSNAATFSRRDPVLPLRTQWEQRENVPPDNLTHCRTVLCPRPLDKELGMRGRPRLTGCAVAFLVSLFEVADRFLGSSGMVLETASRSVERNQTAFRGPASARNNHPPVSVRSRPPAVQGVPSPRPHPG